MLPDYRADLIYRNRIIQTQNRPNMSDGAPIWGENLKSKAFFICNHNKNFHLNNTYALVFYVFYRIIPLNFVLQYLSQTPNTSTSFSLLTNFNKLSLLMASLPVENNQQINLVFTLIVMLLFAVLAFCAYTLQEQRKTRLQKQTLNKLWIIGQISFVLLVLRLPIAVLSLNSIIMLINSQQWYFLPFPFLIFAALAATIYVLEEFSNEDNYSKIVALSRVHVGYQGAASTLQLCIKTAIVVILQHNCTPTLLFLSTISLLIMDLVELHVLVGKAHFLDDFTSVLFQIKLVLSLTIELYSIIVIATQSKLFLDNIFTSIASTTILAFIGLHQYRKYQKQQLLISNLSALTNQEDAARVMIEYLKFLQATNVSKVFLLALVHVHKSICKDSACICKTTDNLAQGQSAWTSFFYKFVLLTLAKISKKYPRSLKVTMVCLNFKLHFMHSFSMTHLHLNRFLKQYGSELSWSDQFALYQMAKGVEQSTDELNQNALRVSLDMIFKEESLEKELRKLIDSINANNFKKYSMIQQEFCKLNTVETICHAITDDIRSIELLWEKFKTSNSFNMKVYAIFLVYNRSIIMSKSTFSDVKTEMVAKLQSLRGLRGVTVRNLAKYIHNKDACVIESQCDKEEIGVITNVSAHCEQVFQLRKDKMKGSNIHNVMADFMAAPHEKMVRAWMQQERLSTNLKEITRTYFVDNSNNCFQGSVFIKIKSTGSLLTFYVIVIKQNDDDFIILNHEEVIQGFGRRLQAQQMLNSSSLQTKFNKFCETNCLVQLQSRSSIKTKILMRDAHQGIKSLRNVNNNGQQQTKGKENHDSESYYYDCSVLITKQHLSTYQYFVVKFLQINKIVRRRTISWMNHNSNQKNSQAALDFKKRSPIKEGIQEIQICNVVSSSQAIVHPDTHAKDQDQMVAENMSVSSCFTGGEINIKLNKMFLISKEKVIRPATIWDERSPITTAAIALLSVILICAMFAVCQIFKAGFSTYQSFLAANVTVRNSNNLMEIVYNNVMTAGIYCDQTNPLYHQQRCTFLLESALAISSESYNMVVDDLRHYLTNNPSLTPLNYFQVFEMSTDFALNAKNITSTMRQLIEQFHYLLQQTALQISQQINNQHFTSSQKLALLLNNWQTLNDINQNAIDFYKEAALDQINLIKRYIAIVIGFIYLMMILLILAWRWFKLYIEEKKEKIARVHGIISSTQCEQLKKAVVIKSNYDLFEQPTRVVKPLGKPIYLTKNQFIYHKDKSYRYFLVPFFLLLTTLNLPILINIAQLIPQSQSLMNSVCDLLSAQKQVLSIYQHAKNAYFFGTDHRATDQINDFLVQMGKESQPKMNTIARNILNLMLTADPNYTSNMNKLFNTDICAFSKDTTQYQYFGQYCGNGDELGVLPQGLLATTTSIHRQTYFTLLLFEHMDNNSSHSPNQFNNTVYSHIDDYQIYLSRVYSLIHKQIMSSLQIMINQTYSTLTLYSVLEVVVLAAGLAFWLVNVRREKEVLSNLYGEVLQFPQALLQDNRLHIKTIEDNLKFDL